MIYLALDTCVSLKLIKADFNQQDNPFEELLYWIENDMAVCITIENLLTEWNKNKVSKRRDICRKSRDFFGLSMSSFFCFKNLCII